MHQRIVAVENHLARDGYRPLLLVGGTTAHSHDIERLQHEFGIAVDHETVLDRKDENLAQIVGRHGALGVLQTPRDLHAHRGGAIQQTSGLHDQIFERHVFHVGILPGPCDLSADGKRPLLLQIVTAGNNQHVVTLQGHVRRRAVQDARQIDGDHPQQQIVALAVEQSTRQERLLLQSFGSGDQLSYGVHVVAQLVHPGTQDRPTHLDPVGEAIQHGVDLHLVAVLQHERTERSGRNREKLMLAARTAHHAHLLGIGIAGKAAGIVDERLQTLARLGFVEHGTFYLALDIDQLAVGRDQNHVALLQADVVRKLAPEDEVVDIQHGEPPPVAQDLHIAERTDARDAAGHV